MTHRRPGAADQHGAPRHEKRPPTLPVRGWVWAVIPAAALAAAVVLLSPALQHASSPVTPTAAAQSLSSSDMPASASAGPTAEAGTPTVDTATNDEPVAPVPGQPVSLDIPAINLHATVGAMSVSADGTVDPPGPAQAYWIRGYGTAGPAATNTVYIAGHTYRGAGGAVFNPLLDIPNSQYTVHPGDHITVGTGNGSYDYTITDTQLYVKTVLSQQTELWQKVPGRLVLITCFQYHGGTSSQQNFVVYAQLTPPAGTP
ncbi:class F sortase [Subtercola sp. RTI3]|uniref:class F sortase n=1 Tax=Subtercola sp. RTI3 TaxID=3048639 RepID=UPI002B232A26|nr:class F sortase [Subtercola sp. RTI3]MEA9986799.1 class F sortase [Subtercola sp. RTI3]